MLKNSSWVRFLAGQELDVVDKEDVEMAVLGSEFLGTAAANGLDEIVGELLRGRVKDAVVAGPDAVTYAVQEVGLAEAGGAVDEERIVDSAGLVGHRLRRGVGQAVLGPDDKALEGVARVQPWLGHRPDGGGAGHCLGGEERLGGGAAVRPAGDQAKGDVHGVADDAAEGLGNERPELGGQPCGGEVVGGSRPQTGCRQTACPPCP